MTIKENLLDIFTPYHKAWTFWNSLEICFPHNANKCFLKKSHLLSLAPQSAGCLQSSKTWNMSFQTCWYMPGISALGKPRQEDFNTLTDCSLAPRVRPNRDWRANSAVKSMFEHSTCRRLGLVPSTHVELLTTACNPASEGSGLWIPWASVLKHTHPTTYSSNWK